MSASQRLEITPELYEELLRRIARHPATSRSILLAQFVRKYNIDYEKTRIDLMHRVAEQQALETRDVRGRPRGRVRRR